MRRNSRNNIPECVLPTPRWELRAPHYVQRLPPVNETPHECHLEPMLIGNYLSKKAPRSACARIQDSSRSNAAQSRWQLGIPPGTEVCTKPELRAVSSRQNKQSPIPEDVLPFYKTKKQYYNLMWDPRICRGPNLIQFTTAQRTKCKYHADLNSSMNFRQRKRVDELHLDQKVYTNVTVQKQPLTYAAYAPFLQDQTEVTYKNASQSMHDDQLRCCNELPPGAHRKLPSGTSTSVQTDLVPCNQQTTDWIINTMTEKIPQQAILELAEEEELETIQGERQRHEMVLLYKKWQKMKQDQWNEYVKAWSKLRMEEIRDEEFYLTGQEEFIGVIAFSKNAINGCFHQTFETMKSDGYISQDGVPYGELEVISDTLDLVKSAEKYVSNRKLIPDQLVDACLVKASLHRFSDHMHHKFGRPHGEWLSRHHHHHDFDRSHPTRSFLEYDAELQRYLEGRGAQKREGARKSGSHFAIRSDFSLFDIFNEDLLSKKAAKLPFQEHHDQDDLAHKIILPKLGKKSIITFAGVDNDNSQEERPSITGKEDSMAILYKRKTEVEIDDYRQRRHSPGNQRASNDGVGSDKKNETRKSGGDDMREVDNDKLRGSEAQQNVTSSEEKERRDSKSEKRGSL